MNASNRWWRRSPRLFGRKPLRAFLDANTLVSGLLFEGNEATLLELGQVGAVKLLTNHYVLSEVSAVIRRREFSLTEEEIEGLTRYMHLCISVLEDPSDEDVLSSLGLLRDKKDIPVALGALSSRSDYLVTGDKELLKAPCVSAITTSGLLQKIYNDQPDETPGEKPSYENNQP